jgi:hypothetical protein
MESESPSVARPRASTWRRRRALWAQGLQSKAFRPFPRRSSDRPRVSASATASLARAGYSRPVEILCGFQAAPGGSMGLGGIDSRRLIREPASFRVRASRRSFRASVWRLSQGSEAGKGFA